MSAATTVHAAPALAASATAERQRQYIATTPPLSRAIVARALSGEGSPRNAIKAKCLTCSGFDRAEVADCRVVTCALWSFRPYQTDDAEIEQ